jgi:hypothetical protein
VYSNTVTALLVPVLLAAGTDLITSGQWREPGPVWGGQREVSVVVALHCRLWLWLCQAIQYDNVLDSVRDNAQFCVHLDENGEVECISVVCCFVARCKLSK